MEAGIESPPLGVAPLAAFGRCFAPLWPMILPGSFSICRADGVNTDKRYNHPMSDAMQGGEGRPPPPVDRFRAWARGSGPGGLELVAMLMLLFGQVLLLAGWIAGIVLLWVSPRWRPIDKVLGTLVSGGLQLTLFADTPLGTLILLPGQLAVTVWLWRRACKLPPDADYTAVAAPAGISLGLALLLGTVGYFFVGFGMATSCTDKFENVHRCDTLYHWLTAGAVGQFAIAIASAALIVIAKRTSGPQRRLRAFSWPLIPLSLAWIAITSILGGLSFGY